jgi:GNAT superfamily N-acetyltransferase
MDDHYRLRFATSADAALIASHRQSMFRDNKLAEDATLLQMSEAFDPWVRERLDDGRYAGLLLEHGDRCIAAAGIYFCDFPPHWRHTEAMRAYVLNVYTDPEFRGQGLAKRLMQDVLQECIKRGVATVVLHASPQGRPIYEAMGFVDNDEMILSLKIPASNG